ncbi:unnamed protein product [Rhizophagus irregularis]|nr:unnamed protein product [Rhizophagus irregularis]
MRIKRPKNRIWNKSLGNYDGITENQRSTDSLQDIIKILIANHMGIMSLGSSKWSFLLSLLHGKVREYYASKKC